MNEFVISWRVPFPVSFGLLLLFDDMLGVFEIFGNMLLACCLHCSALPQKPTLGALFLGRCPYFLS
jgi:hypothetical protein